MLKANAEIAGKSESVSYEIKPPRQQDSKASDKIIIQYKKTIMTDLGLIAIIKRNCSTKKFSGLLTLNLAGNLSAFRTLF
jgi:hypothetical protein